MPRYLLLPGTGIGIGSRDYRGISNEASLIPVSPEDQNITSFTSDRWDAMQTPYDWLTIAIFAGLIVIFLQRSTSQDGPRDTLLSYLPPAIGCAVCNYLGNEGYDLLAVAGLILVLAYTHFVIRPFKGLKW